MKKYTRIGFMVLGLLLTFGIASCSNDKTDETAYVYVDINPSFELSVNANGTVDAFYKTNQDAQIMMYQEDIIGLDVAEAVEVIVEKAIEFGYITKEEANKIMINAVAKSEKSQAKIEKRIQARIEKAANKKQIIIDLISQHDFSEAEIALALELNISVYKLKLINEAMTFDFELTYDAAASMSITSLVKIINEHRFELEDLMTDEYMNQYLEQKRQRLQVLKIGRTALIATLSNLKLITVPNFYDEYLVGANITKETLVLMYGNYQADLLNVNVTDTTEQVTFINTMIENDIEIQAQIESQNTLKLEIKALYDDMKNTSNPLMVMQAIKPKLMTYNQIEVDIRLRVEALMTSSQVDYEYTYVYKDGKVAIFAKYDFVDHYRIVRASHDSIFAGEGLTIDSFEALFEDSLFNQLSNLDNQFKLQMKNCHMELNLGAKESRLQIEIEHETRRHHGNNN